MLLRLDEPHFDSFVRTGTYKYIEATGPNLGEKAHLVSPLYTKVAGDCDVSFWYHMYGEHVGHLKVRIQIIKSFAMAPPRVASSEEKELGV